MHSGLLLICFVVVFVRETKGIANMFLSSRNRSLVLLGACFCTGGNLFSATHHSATQTGTAVYYSDKMDGTGVALKGEKYDKTALTAATHNRYPLGSRVRVTNLSNHKAVTVKINDRMNPRSKSAIDLSRKAAEQIGMINSGHAKVKIALLRAK